MSDITIPAEIIGDPEYDSKRETLTFFGSSAILIAQLLKEAREKRERDERDKRLGALLCANASRYSERAWTTSELHKAFQAFAYEIKAIYEVQP